MAPDAVNVNVQSAASASRRRFLRVAPAVLSFVIYGCTIFALPQARDARYCCEQSSVAAAVSKVMYGAQLGTLYSGVFDYLIAHFNEPLEQTLQEARMPTGGLPTKPPGVLFRTTRDGNGVGYPLVATAAFRVIGMHTWALTLTMLLLMALSAVIFLLRFSRAAYAGFVILYFAALTVMLFTPLMWDPSYNVQIPVGGIRYFSLVSVLPIFHIFLELIETKSTAAIPRKRLNLLLGLQSAILVLVMLVRGSTLPLIAAIVLVIGVLAWRWWRERDTLRALVGKAVVIGVASSGTLAAIALSVPHEYLTQGRFGTVIWDRVVESLGANPAYPFPGVKEMFDCQKYVPGGMKPSWSDDDGHCIWFDYVTKHHIPIETIGDKTYGGLYETAMRQAFFKLVARYPREALVTFVYYKPLLIVHSIGQDLRFNFSGDQSMAVYAASGRTLPYSVMTISLLILSVGVAFINFCVTKVCLTDVARIAEVMLLAVLSTLPSYFAVWANPPTSSDLLLYCLMALGFAVAYGTVWIRSSIWRQAPEPSIDIASVGS